MARKKVELRWIESDSARRASLKKRRQGLLKKVNELTTLCGIDGCAVIVSPGDDEPMHWPPTREGVEQVMGRFFSLPEMEQCKKMTTLESYLGEKGEKLQEKITKQEKKRCEMEVNQVMHQIFGHGRKMEELSKMELDGLSWFMEEKRKEVKRKIQFLKQGAGGTSGVDEAGHIGGGNGVEAEGMAAVEGALWDQWPMGTVNPNENIGGDGRNNNMGVPHWNIGSSNNGGRDMGLPQGTIDNGSVNNMGVPHWNIGGSYGGNDMGPRPPHGTIGGDNSGGGNNTGVPCWNMCSSSDGGHDMGLPQGGIGGSSLGGGYNTGAHWNMGGSYSGGNDMGLPWGTIGGGNSMGVPPWNIGSSSGSGNDMGPPQRTISGSGSGGGNTVRPSYEIPKSWPYNFSAQD